MRCIIVDDDPISCTLLSEHIAKTDYLVEAGRFGDSIEAINFLRQNTDIGIIFLDVRMPGMDGFELLESLDHPPQVIMVSASEEYALRAFDFGAIDYLLKPITYARFFKAVSKALKSMHTPPTVKELFLKKNSALVRVPYDSIIWIESMENYVIVYTEKERFTLHFTLKMVEVQMPASIFRRIHRSYIVNIGKIESIEDSAVIVMRNGESVSLSIGKSYRDNLLSSLRFITQK